MAGTSRAAHAHRDEEDEGLRAVRARAEEADLAPVDADTGALLRFLARLLRVRHAVEIGSGGGASGLWLLGGMGRRSTLTTVEPGPQAQALAQQAYAEARVGDRVRAMRGHPADVLHKLADANYDLMLLHQPWQQADVVAQAARLLRPGGLLVALRVGTAQHVLATLMEAGPFRVLQLDLDGGVLAALLDVEDDQ